MACPFDRVQVSNLARGGAVVYWRIRPDFQAPRPWWFELQAGSTGNPLADDWAPVGPPVADVAALADPVRRGHGRELTTHYRVRLRTSTRDALSSPVPVTGPLGPHDWAIARDIVRRARLKFRLYGWDGWLLKRRDQGNAAPLGPPGETTVDPVTGVQTMFAPGTGGDPFIGDYYAPWPCAIDVSASAHAVALDPARGTVDDAGTRVTALFVQAPLVQAQDAYIAAGSDRRYYVAGTRDVAEWRGVPLLAECELRMAATNDPLHNVPAPSPRAVPVFSVPSGPV